MVNVGDIAQSLWTLVLALATDGVTSSKVYFAGLLFLSDSLDNERVDVAY